METFRLEWLIIGNISAKESTSLVRDVQKLLYQAVTPSSWVPGSTLLRDIPLGSSFVQVKVKNENCANCASQVYWQLPRGCEATVRLLSVCCRSYYFNVLRTQKQLGYIVWSLFSGLVNSCAFTVIVQSNSVLDE